MTVFRLTLAIALCVLVAGSVVMAARWFSPAGRRLPACASAFGRALFRGRFLAMSRSLILEILLQFHVLRQSPVRWLAHFAIFAGFFGLFFMHALEPVLSRPYFPDYEPTLDPYQFLRNLFGAMVLLGAALALVRRLAVGRLRRISGPEDWLALGLLFAIILSGHLFDAAKTLSERSFDRMAADYLPSPAPEELEAVKAFWAASYGSVFETPPPKDPQTVEAGKELSDASCAMCHAPASSAFVTRPMVLALQPIAPEMERLRADEWLHDAHYLLFFLFIAWLPFSKFRHILTAPVSLLCRAAAGIPGEAGGPAAETRRAMALDACVHCGACSLVCSVGPSYEALADPAVLPSEKLKSLFAYWRGKPQSVRDRGRLAEGSFTCTACYRCSRICPCGIDLQDLWLASKRELNEKGPKDPYVFLRGRAEIPPPPVETLMRPRRMGAAHLPRLTGDPGTFAPCVQCSTCTSVCPVTAALGASPDDIDASPHQIMNLVRMGLRDDAIATRMVWNCVTCYKCQEFCPQGIKVADVLFELRNLAHARLRDVDFQDLGDPPRTDAATGRGA